MRTNRPYKRLYSSIDRGVSNSTRFEIETISVKPEKFCSCFSAIATVYEFAYNTVPETNLDAAKAIVWAFVAGFAEGFVPNFIDKLINDTEEEP